MKVLLVENDHKVAHILKKGLEGEDFEVDVLYDTKDASARSLDTSYGLVIVSQLLGSGSKGLDIVKAMRDANVHTPVLLTGVDSNADSKAARNAGADDYVAKPFSVSEILARVRSLLHYPEGKPSSLLTAGDLTLDYAARIVTRAGRPIHLTSKEFALLEYMMRNQGRPLSKEDIIGHIWSYDADVLDNTVEVYIKYLRQKVDEPFKKPLIFTARGFGYRVQP